MRVGLMGGTFNPIHIGHLRMAQEAMDAHQLDQVWLIPNGRPPHREVLDTSPEDRHMMTLLASLEHSGLRVSRVEIDDPTQPYSFQTVERIKRQFPDLELFFLTGADAVLNYVWKNFDQLLGNVCGFIVCSRPGFDWEKLKEKLKAENLAHLDRMKYLEIPMLEISSTDIRARVQLGRSLRFLVPRAVEEYIHRQKLYLPRADS